MSLREDLDPLRQLKFSNESNAAILNAAAKAYREWHPFVTTGHLLLGLWLVDGISAAVLREFNITTASIEMELLANHITIQADVVDVKPSHTMRRLFNKMVWDTRQKRELFIGTEDLLLALVNYPQWPGLNFLKSAGADVITVQATVVSLLAQVESKSKT